MSELCNRKGCPIELLKPEGVHLYEHKSFEFGVHGGLSVITKRYAKANSPALTGYNSEEPESSLIYFDANALYSFAMAQPLPIIM